MAGVLRLYLLAFYGVAVAVLLVQVLPAAARVRNATLRAEGGARWLPWVLLPVGFLVPPLAIVSRIGEIEASGAPVRLIGVALSLYAAVMMLWSAATLGRLLVPQAVVQTDHELVTTGPYRVVRHPAYSGDLALWLASALATLDAALLTLWPFYILGVWVQTRVEERLLTQRFGRAYLDYAARVGRLVPRADLARLTGRQAPS